MLTTVRDDVFGAGLVAEAASAWPDADWPHWLTYDNPLERKRTCRDWSVIPEPCRRLLSGLMRLMADEYPGVVPDASLYGAGMCDMRDGDHLQLHQDHDRHPLLGLRRRVNAVLFLSAATGGELRLWDAGADGPTVTIRPVPGWLVLFSPDVPHDVARIIAGPAGVRAALSVYGYGGPWLSPAAAERPRARFLRPAGADDGLDGLRADRCARPDHE